MRNIFYSGISPKDRQPIAIPGRVEDRVESGWPPVGAHSGVIRQAQISAIFITPETHLSAATRRFIVPTNIPSLRSLLENIFQ